MLEVTCQADLLKVPDHIDAHVKNGECFAVFCENNKLYERVYTVVLGHMYKSHFHEKYKAWYDPGSSMTTNCIYGLPRDAERLGSQYMSELFLESHYRDAFARYTPSPLK